MYRNENESVFHPLANLFLQVCKYQIPHNINTKLIKTDLKLIKYVYIRIYKTKAIFILK